MGHQARAKLALDNLLLQHRESDHEVSNDYTRPGVCTLLAAPQSQPIRYYVQMKQHWQVKHVLATLPGRYLFRPPDDPPPPHPLLVGFHGYAENAQIHLQDLLAIPGAGGWFCCAIQGLHSFYHRDRGDVVASWMTRLDRERVIVANVSYVAQVLDQLHLQNRLIGPRIFAGFSQGTAMAYRAAVLGGHSVDGLLILAGDVPPELTCRQLARINRVLIGIGTRDGLYREDKLRADQIRLEEAGVQVHVVRFAGGHEWHPQFLQAAGEFLSDFQTHCSDSVRLQGESG
jgi:predicted esterase